MKALRVLLVGTGRMAHTHARRFNAIDGCQVVAAVDIVPELLSAFCDRHAIRHRFSSIDEALAFGEFDAVSVVTPDVFHAPVVLPCLAAGLPVLCEKPLADTTIQAQLMADAAARSGVLNLMNLTYRSSGALCEARRLVDAGELGELRHVEAAYRQSWLVSDYWGVWNEEDAWLWRLSTAHGSLGVLGDVGIHILDYTLAGCGLHIDELQCRLQTFDKAPDNRVGHYVLDANDSCMINTVFDNGALGSITMSRYASGHQNDLELSVFGTRGAVKIATTLQGDTISSSIGADMHRQRWSERTMPAEPDTFDRFVDAWRNGLPESPDFAHAASLQRLLERCFESDAERRWLSVDGPMA